MSYRRIWSHSKGWLRRFWPKQKRFPQLLPLFPVSYHSSPNNPHNASHIHVPFADDPQAVNVTTPNEPKRYALLIGIQDCKDPSLVDKSLPGARGDIELHKEILKNALEFQDSEIKIMSDQLDEGDPLYPNRVNIIRELQTLGSSLRKGDLGYFSFSGHVKQLSGHSGAEIDGLDEALVPADSTGKRDTLIIDDELNTLLVAPLPAGATLLVVCDSCHSETILDLPWKYDLGEEIKDLDAPLIFADAGTQVSTPLPESSLKIIQAHKTYQGGKGFVLCMSACLDGQRGFEAKHPETGRSYGATTLFLNLLFRNLIDQNGDIDMTHSSTPMTAPTVQDILVRSSRIYQKSGHEERIQITTTMPLPNPLFSRQDPEAISGWRINLKHLLIRLRFAFRFRFFNSLP